VGLSTRGRDTGDAQLFINLVDNPRLDFEYTVFGYVKPEDMDAVDNIAEGDAIDTIKFDKTTTEEKVSVVGIGLPFALGSLRVVASFLYEVSPGDPVILIGTGILLALLGISASFVPARRAAGTDPWGALRQE
jgi:ABC-type lipoprotein release transport system permease subunit